jgi:hypothetical protein
MGMLLEIGACFIDETIHVRRVLIQSAPPEPDFNAVAAFAGMRVVLLRHPRPHGRRLAQPRRSRSPMDHSEERTFIVAGPEGRVSPEIEA